MSAKITGKQIVWGIPSDITGVTDGVLSAGIGSSFSPSRGGSTETVIDEDGDIVTRVDHGVTNTFSMEVTATTDTSLPEKGDEIIIAVPPTIDGIDLSVGRIFVDEASATYAGGSAKKCSASVAHYPDMLADA